MNDDRMPLHAPVGALPSIVVGVFKMSSGACKRGSNTSVCTRTPTHPWSVGVCPVNRGSATPTRQRHQQTPNCAMSVAATPNKPADVPADSGKSWEHNYPHWTGPRHSSRMSCPYAHQHTTDDRALDSRPTRNNAGPHTQTTVLYSNMQRPRQRREAAAHGNGRHSQPPHGGRLVARGDSALRDSRRAAVCGRQHWHSWRRPLPHTTAAVLAEVADTRHAASACCTAATHTAGVGVAVTTPTLGKVLYGKGAAHVSAAGTSQCCWWQHLPPGIQQRPVRVVIASGGGAYACRIVHEGVAWMTTVLHLLRRITVVAHSKS